MTSGNAPVMEEQLSCFIMTITTMTDGFGEVKTRFESLIDAVLTKALEAATVERIGSVSTGMWIRNVKIPSHAINTNIDHLNASFQ